ncbi:hypothetical protein TARUN_8495 [Trichoderma arundinaceum]|uniref:Uncharacterized protein n=1 Tax=Trichoderma arundinaceum TaxID=490622 RepID=A0A395NCC3_TRIAR|nr:hypothetical protein TARUN_8495 [Trichoderma arundinaceum]
MQAAAVTYMEPYARRVVFLESIEKLAGFTKQGIGARNTRPSNREAHLGRAHEVALRRAKQISMEAQHNYVQSMKIAALRAVVIDIVSRTKRSLFYGPGSPA